MTDKIIGRQWTVLEHLAAAERAGETVRQTWLPVGGPLEERAVRALEWAGLCRTLPANEVLRAHAARPPEARAVRITPEGMDALAWHHHRTNADRPCSAWTTKAADPAYQEIALQPHEMLLLRRYTHLLPGLAAAPAAAGTLWEALIEAHYDTEANRWRLQLDDTGLAGLAHAVHLEALAGQVTARNRLHRTYGLTHPDPVPITPAAETPVDAAALE
ncbi:DUF6417 family protein [Streptomyces pini]|uniref:Uncharacterized protein n=1 Tax=Streptomyces pini TaxID=1520580 RepID=A0A1I4JQJ1_9ACTN|nr:DUF6417 family protein [Streptomyces pini]SFL68744.1 hypothetical protein SAMN05192584_12448 [Streptomyces pini]